MLNKQECQDYWRKEANDIGNIDKQMNINNPILYANKSKTIIDYLHNFWSPEVSKTDTILELGCNSGANLFHLWNLGYEKLDGIDINEQAIVLMSKLFPDIYTKCGLYIGSLEEMLPTIPDKSIDVTFSIAVLEHIHPESEKEVFSHLVRITKKYIITIEEEIENLNERIFLRDYKNIIENLGCKQIKHYERTDIEKEVEYLTINYLIDGKIKKVGYRNSFGYEHITPRMFKVL